MRTDVIEFVKTEKKSFVFRHENIFTFRKDLKHHWLQKACFWVLSKIGANWREDQVKYERIVVRPKDFMSTLFAQKREIEYQFNNRPTKMFIGSDDYDELMSQKTFGQMISFDTEYRYGTQSGVMICGLNVQVIPWMRGILVLP